MKKIGLLNLVGVTLIVFAQSGLAASRGGGGGGFHGGGSFGGGNFGGRGGVRGGGGFGRSTFGGPRSLVPSGHFSSIRPGHGFSSSDLHQSREGQRAIARSNRPFTNQSPRATIASSQRPGHRTNRPTAPNIGRNQGPTSSSAERSRRLPQRGLNGRTDHISERHTANWHRNWDHRHAHFHHGRFFIFYNGLWFGLDNGFFPWDYLPYYAFDYYPYDYYTDSVDAQTIARADSVGPTADSTVVAAQAQLNQLGYFGGPVDGIFGPDTRDAVARYQIAKHLNVTGSLSPDTLQSLGLPQIPQS